MAATGPVARGSGSPGSGLRLLGDARFGRVPITAPPLMSILKYSASILI